jgi:hypothetical protein
MSVLCERGGFGGGPLAARDPQVNLHTLDELSLEGSCTIMLTLHPWIKIVLV